MVFRDQFLEKGEYFNEVIPKTTIYIHHTAGGHRPDWTISGWDTDDTKDSTGKDVARIVATAYVIGGSSTSGNDTAYDGKIYRAFDEKLWAHHLGTKQANNKLLNQQSIGIEICNYGQLRKGSDGTFFNYVNKPVPADMVVMLEKPFRGYTYYHKYTPAQIASLRDLILNLTGRYNTLSKKTPLTSPDGFEINADAMAGKGGIYSHSNVRSDKNDCSPQSELIAMLQSLQG